MKVEGPELSNCYTEYLSGDYKAVINNLQKLLKQQGQKNINIYHNLNVCEYLLNRSSLQAYNTLNKLYDFLNDTNPKTVPINKKNKEHPNKIPQQSSAQNLPGQQNILKYNIAALMGTIGRRDNMEMVLKQIYSQAVNPFAWKIAFLLLELEIFLDKKVQALQIAKHLHAHRNMIKKFDEKTKSKITGFSFPDNNGEYNYVSSQQYNFLLDIYKAQLCLKFGFTKSALKFLPKRENMKIQQVIKEGLFTYKNSNIFELNLLTMLKFANAHYEYQTKCYQKALKLLSPHNLMEVDINSNKYLSGVTYLSHNNIGLINYKLEKYTLALIYISKGLENLSKFNVAAGQEREQIVVQHFQSKHQFLLFNQALVLLKLGKYKQSYQHFCKLNKATDSYKFWYRFGQASIKYFHELLQENKSIHQSDLYDQIHDNYEPTYSYPNLPYVKLHDEKKKINLSTNKPPYYRRYILHKADYFIEEENLQQDKKISKKQTNLLHIKSVLNKAQNLFQNCYLCLIRNEHQKIIQKIDFKGIGQEQQIETEEEQSHTKKRLNVQYSNFKQSTLLILAYIAICKRQYSKTIKYCLELLDIPKVSEQNGYSASIYLAEAYIETQKYPEAMELFTNKYLKIQGKNYSPIKCRDSLASSEAYFESMNHDNLTRYNMAILHIKGNNLIQANAVIQTLLNQMSIVQNNVNAKIPNSILNLLIYWYLRTDNSWAALHLIKRRRLLTIPTMNNSKALLKITK